MIRLFATDLDRTLLNEAHSISEEDLNALERLHQAGVEVCFASGRNELEVDLVVETVSGVSHRICQNGAFVSDRTQKRIFEGYFATDLAKEIFRISKESDLYCFIGTAKEMFTTVNSFRYPECMLPHGRVYVVDMEQRIGEDVLPSKFCFLGEQTDLLQFQQKVLHRFSEEIDTFISGDHYLDVMPAGIHKGNGILLLSEYLGINLSEVACIGDSENDIPMFDVVPHSYVMGAANLQVQNTAKYVVSSVSEAVDRVLAFNKSLSS